VQDQFWLITSLMIGVQSGRRFVVDDQLGLQHEGRASPTRFAFPPENFGWDIFSPTSSAKTRTSDQVLAGTRWRTSSSSVSGSFWRIGKATLSKMFIAVEQAPHVYWGIYEPEPDDVFFGQIHSVSYVQIDASTARGLGFGLRGSATSVHENTVFPHPLSRERRTV